MPENIKSDCEFLKKGFLEIASELHVFSDLLDETSLTKDVTKAKPAKNNLKNKISSLWERISNVPREWRGFYQMEFNIDLSKVRIKIPEKKEGFDRLIVVAQGLTLNQIYEACEKYFTCYRYTPNLDKGITHNDRKPTKTYAIRVKDNRVADPEHGNKSADQIKKEGIQGITLLERLVFELEYYFERRLHLDVGGVTETSCSGSRDNRDKTPDVHFTRDTLWVDFHESDYAGDQLRTREVVS